MDFVTNIYDFFKDILFTPLSWMPSQFLDYFILLADIFALFLLGRVLKWIWDSLPFI